MGSVYSIVMAHAHRGTAGSSDLASVPAGTTWVVRDIALWCSDTTASQPAQVVYYDGSHNIPIAGFDVLAAQAIGQWQGRVVVASGWTIRLLKGAGDLTLSISGYQLEGT